MLPPSGPEWTDVSRPGVSRAAAATSQRRLSHRDGPHRHPRRDRPPQTPKMAKVEGCPSSAKLVGWRRTSAR